MPTTAEILEAARALTETINTTLESLEGSGKAEVAKALASVLNAVAAQIAR